MLRCYYKLLLNTLILVMLSGCGGGGDGTSPQEEVPTGNTNGTTNEGTTLNPSVTYVHVKDLNFTMYINQAKYSQLRRDSENPNELVSYEIVSNPTHGKIESFDPATGVFIYTPDINYTGSDAFVYRLVDAKGNMSENNATVGIDVKLPPEPKMPSERLASLHIKIIDENKKPVVGHRLFIDGGMTCKSEANGLCRLDYLHPGGKGLGVPYKLFYLSPGEDAVLEATLHSEGNISFAYGSDINVTEGDLKVFDNPHDAFANSDLELCYNAVSDIKDNAYFIQEGRYWDLNGYIRFKTSQAYNALKPFYELALCAPGDGFNPAKIVRVHLQKDPKSFFALKKRMQIAHPWSEMKSIGTHLYAFEEEGTRGLMIYDISDPLNPLYVTSIGGGATEYPILQILSNGTLLTYATENTAGDGKVRLVDLSTNQIVSTLSFFDLQEYSISKNYLFVVAKLSNYNDPLSLHIYDIQDATHPVHIAEYTTADLSSDVTKIWGVVVYYDKVYLTTDKAKFSTDLNTDVTATTFQKVSDTGGGVAWEFDEGDDWIYKNHFFRSTKSQLTEIFRIADITGGKLFESEDFVVNVPANTKEIAVVDKTLLDAYIHPRLKVIRRIVTEGEKVSGITIVNNKYIYASSYMGIGQPALLQIYKIW